MSDYAAAARPLRVSVLGHGAIGSSVAQALAEGDIPGVILAGVVTRPGSANEHGRPKLTLDDALGASDLIVECAGTAAVAEFGPHIVRSGADLMLVSIGALADASLRESLLHGGPGRCYLTAGAVGGLDLLGAAARSGGLDSITLTTTKRARTLIQPWMTSDVVEELTSSDQPVTVFEGDVVEAIRLFPKSLNVAVALAVATDLWDGTRVRMIADPAAELTSHEIAAHGAAGTYRFSISNLPHEKNPATSNLVPAAILHGLAKLARPSGTFV